MNKLLNILRILTVIVVVVAADQSLRTTTQSKSEYNANEQRRRSKSRVLVTGGFTITKSDEYPFIAFPTGSKNCAGTLIHDDMVLTAANCGDAFAGGLFLGGTTIDGKGSERFKVLKSIPHPDFSPATNENDIMILKLSKPATDVPKVKLNFKTDVGENAGEGIDVLGYGATSNTSLYSETLQRGKILIAGIDRCYQYRWFDEKRMICSWFPAGGRDSCNGDAGGPILLKNTNNQIGVVSYGLECGNREYPSVNTRVSAYSEFIRSVICELSSVKPTGQTCANLAPLSLKRSGLAATVVNNPLLGSGLKAAKKSNPLRGKP